MTKTEGREEGSLGQKREKDLDPRDLDPYAQRSAGCWALISHPMLVGLT